MTTFETRPRAPNLEEGLAARVHDPLWLLARQWQFGEFRGEDAASVAYVDSTAQAHELDAWRAGPDGDWQRYRRGTEPLERLVEQEPSAGPDPRLRLEGGLRLRRLLADAGQEAVLDTFLAHCGFEDEPADAPAPAPGGLPAAVRARVPDGARLSVVLKRLAGGGEAADREAERLGLPAPARGAVAAAAAAWVDWWAARAPDHARADHPATWDEHRLEHAFEVRASSLPDIRLSVAGWGGGRLDWWAFDAVAEADPPAPHGTPLSVEQRSIPGPARFGGMPAPRFWEMEDARFDPGAIEASRIDLGRLLLVGFATVYGNDWLVAPVRLPIGSLVRMTRFAVTDVFGRTVEPGPAGAADDGWNLFGLSVAGGERGPGGERPTSEWFLLAPALPDALQSPPVESVLLLRDEMANLAWAVEALVADDAGGGLDRFSQWAARERPELVDLEVPRYRIDTDVPDHWLPLAPEQLADMASVRLRLVPLARGDGSLAEPLGRVLAGARGPDAPGIWLFEEEVPRAGAAVHRTHQSARSHDGATHLWTARRKRTGGGEGSSGLRFDTVDPRGPRP